MSFNGFDGINVGSDPNDPNALPGDRDRQLVRRQRGDAQRPGRHLPGIDGHRQHADAQPPPQQQHPNLSTGADAVDLSTGTGTAGTANKWKDNEIGTSIPKNL